MDVLLAAAGGPVHNAVAVADGDFFRRRLCATSRTGTRTALFLEGEPTVSSLNSQSELMLIWSRAGSAGRLDIFFGACPRLHAPCIHMTASGLQTA